MLARRIILKNRLAYCRRLSSSSSASTITSTNTTTNTSPTTSPTPPTNKTSQTIPNQNQDQPIIPRVTPVTKKAHFSEPPPEVDNDGLFLSIKSQVQAHKQLSVKQTNLEYLEKNLGKHHQINSFADLPLEFGHNQHIAINNDMRERLRSILWNFNAPIKYAFAYGSGVFTQGAASDASKPQVDLIFGVSYTEHWHSLNMRQNPSHYSSLRWLGSGAVSFVQDKLGSGVYFNPYVEIDGVKIKYGVVNVNTLLHDLSSWNTLYLAGRLHKPVKILRDDPRIRFANQANLISALRTALLLLPESFSELDLYTTLAGISYMGDPRMAFGENPNKVRNIVHNQFVNFRSLYSPILDVLPNVELQSSAKFALESNRDIAVATLRQDMDPKPRGNMVARLPTDFRNKIYLQYSSSPVQDHPMGSKLDQKIAADVAGLQGQVARAIKNTVQWPSFTQSVKGVLTAGVYRSTKYALEKLSKARTAKKD
ncbi:uncharacterized protein SAPINGB_P006173 [Magnusiomyces paraingens]|uniref:Phosphatidate cytidylyltransferase, mitochondrial n=1 Tax=Magnusiomyces paraingens TaxID=2606893 RepID=A0A5E8C4T8_9ASCO|nr:uncharacterized protein SAPINGB_P006173 [Saprochaete ingens]VVT58372.1 unnamed protein product [Saprochaete ingens]